MTTLLDNLIAHWPLSESSGTRTDLHTNTYALTDNNTVGSTSGINHNAALFVRANSEYLSIADNANLSAGDVEITFAVWVKLTSKPAGGQQVVFGKWESAGINDLEYLCDYFQTPDRFRFVVRNTANTATTVVTANNLGSPSTGAWYFIVCWHDPTANTINIQINNGTADSAATSGGVRDSTNQLRLGAKGTNSDYLDAAMMNFAIWKRLLDAAEKTRLYGAGVPLEYPFGGLLQRMNQHARYRRSA